MRYQGPLDMPNSLKLEIDFTQNVVVVPKEMEYKNLQRIYYKEAISDTNIKKMLKKFSKVLLTSTSPGSQQF